jgi:hypothetical protein
MKIIRELEENPSIFMYLKSAFMLTYTVYCIYWYTLAPVFIGTRQATFKTLALHPRVTN